MNTKTKQKLTGAGRKTKKKLKNLPDASAVSPLELEILLCKFEELKHSLTDTHSACEEHIDKAIDFLGHKDYLYHRVCIEDVMDEINHLKSVGDSVFERSNEIYWRVEV